MPETIRNYEFHERLGAGHASRVHRAVHKPTSKIVAIRVTPYEYLKKEIGPGHSYTEPKVYRHLKHENIVQFYDFFIEDDDSFLVTEYVDGYNLRQCIERHRGSLAEGRPCLAHLMDTALRICEGLIYLHNQKIVHGHIKPENILVSREVAEPFETHRQVNICDFALAGLVRGFFHPSAHLKGGSLEYMSPEQLKQKK